MQANQHARLFSRWLERTPDLASLALVIVCGFLLARLVWMLFPAAPRPVLTDTTTAVETSPAAVAQNPADKLAGFHLFGQYQPDAAPAAANIQPTQLALKLQGVYSPAGRKGFAVIEENGQQKAYAAGEAIGNSGAVLDQVLGDHVLLRRNGLLEKLALPETRLSGGGGSAPAGMEADMPADMPPPDIGQPPPEMLQPPDMFTPSEGAVPPPQNEAIPTEQPQQPAPAAEPAAGGNANLGEFRQSVLNNNMRLLEVASPQPYERDGKFLGFQLSPGSNVSLFNQLGLQAGDIVTSINGTALDSPATAMRMLQDAGTASQVSLNITRNGQEISLPINFQ